MGGKKVYVANYEHLGKVLWGNKTIDDLLDTEDERLTRYPGFKLGWDNEAFTYDALEKDDPALMQKMVALFRKYPGRIGMGTSTYGQPLSFYIGGESNVRQLTQGIRTAQQFFGCRPLVYIMSEHAFHAQMPQLLAMSGFEGAIMRTHFMMYGANPEIDQAVVNWKGLDGIAGIATIPTYVGQASYCEYNGFTYDKRTRENFPFGFNTLDNRILTDAPDRHPFKMLEEFGAEFLTRIEAVVASRADDPRQPEGIPERYAGHPDFPFVIDGEIMDAVGAPKVDMTTGVEDFFVRMPWGYCGNWMWEKGREAESLAYTTEYLDTLMLMADKGHHKRQLVDAWKMILICQHHDILICGIEEDARQYFGEGFRNLREIDKDFLKGQKSCAWFNSLSWKRFDPIPELGGWCPGVPAGSCVEAKAPGVNSACVWNEKTRVLDTPYYTVQCGEHGGFDQIAEKKTGYKLFVEGRRSGILAATVDGKFRVEVGSWRIERQSHAVIAVDEGTIGGIPYKTEWTFYDAFPRIDAKMELVFRDEKVGRASEDTRDTMSAFQHEEKLRMKFYPNLSEHATGLRDQPYGVAPTRRTYIEGGLWTALCDEERGLAILNRGIMESTREVDGGLSVPLAFSMYYIWSGTRSRADSLYQDANALVRELGGQAPGLIGKHFLNGAYVTHLALYPFQGDWMAAQLHRRALEYNQPFHAVGADTAGMIAAHPLAISAPENVFVSALYHEDEQPYLRVFEMEGKQADISVSYEGRALSLQETDLLENPLADPVQKARILPRQVKTYRLIR